MNFEEVLIEESDIRFDNFKTWFPEVLDWKSNGIQKWHFILIDNDPQKCIFKRGYSNSEPVELCFEEIYLSMKDRSYERLLLLMSYYQVIPKDVLIQKLNESYCLPNFFNHDVLKKNRDYRIAFSDQLEVLYRSLTDASPWEAVEFRRDINKKNQHTIQKAKQIKATQTLSLYDLIFQKSFYDSGPFFLTPNYYGARLLYNKR